MGPHAGEPAGAIFERKMADIRRVGKTYWIIHSQGARPDTVMKMCSAAPAIAVFIEPATPGGARPATMEARADEFSEDQGKWQPFPKLLSPVTGKLDAGTTALVFDKLDVVAGTELDLWSYADFTDTQSPVRFRLGCSTVCAIREDMSGHVERMRSRFRSIAAIARLAAPYGVWVRQNSRLL